MEELRYPNPADLQFPVLNSMLFETIPGDFHWPKHQTYFSEMNRDETESNFPLPISSNFYLSI